MAASVYTYAGARPWILRCRRLRFLIFQIVLGFAGLRMVVWFETHYLAPLTASIFALPLQAIRGLRIWRVRGRPVGVGLSRVVVLFLVLLAFFGQRDLLLKLPNQPNIGNLFASQLDRKPGKHLIIVRYPPGYDSFSRYEWVYNGADIDNSKVVWAREVPGVSVQPLLDYFRDRQIWVAEPGASPPRLTPQDSTGR